MYNRNECNFSIIIIYFKCFHYDHSNLILAVQRVKFLIDGHETFLLNHYCVFVISEMGNFPFQLVRYVPYCICKACNDIACYFSKPASVVQGL